MSKFTGFPQAPIGVFYEANHEYPEHDLGSKLVSDDGREFRYAKAGASALVRGNLLQAPAEVTNHQNLAPTATTAIGAMSLTVTLGATAATANQYAGGYVVVTVTPGLGQMVKIRSHPAADSAATLTVALDEPLSVALTTTSRVDLVPNPYNGVVQNPTTATSAPVGVATKNITAGYYGWVQTKGAANVTTEGTIVVGAMVVASNGTAGAVEDGASATDQARVGTALSGVGSGENGAILLNLP